MPNEPRHPASKPMSQADPYLPHEATVVERIAEAPTIFTLRLAFTDPALHRAYTFKPGQFNMVYLHGVGEVPISIVSDPEDERLYDHTIRAVGRVTRGLAKLAAGHRLGIRGPYGRGWPLEEAQGQDVLIVTGGLGCAPVVSVINYLMRRRERFGRVIILQGVKHAADLIWSERYRRWSQLPHTEVHLSAGQSGPQWPWHVGHVTELLEGIELDAQRTLSMICGPEGMMIAAVQALTARGLAESAIFLSMERNMQCGVGHCGHCQYGGKFICRQGPVFPYSELKELLGTRGF